jgi:hypothetical protein
MSAVHATKLWGAFEARHSFRAAIASSQVTQFTHRSKTCSADRHGARLERFRIRYLQEAASYSTDRLPGMTAPSPARFPDRHGLQMCVRFLVAAMLISGCADIELKFTEVRRIDEPISTADLEAWLEIVDHLPDKKLPDLRNPFLPPPHWTSERTLPVGDLVDSELASMDERWSHMPLLELLPESRTFDRWLKRKRMTREQFAGLTMSIGAALSRSTLRKEQDLQSLIERGEAVVHDLRSDRTPFNRLSPESIHEVLQRATWITRLDRARRLQMVPDNNLAVIRKYRKQLVDLFPVAFTTNPFDPIADRLEELGIPFEELPGREPLDVLTWDSEKAIVGRDAPQ